MYAGDFNLAKSLEFAGLSPNQLPIQNSSYLAEALQSGGTWSLVTPGTYTLRTWPTDIPVATSLYLGVGVVLSDGGASITGPITLQGGLWPNGKVATDAATTNAQATVTSTNIGFTQADVGKTILVRRTDGTLGAYRSTILSVAGNVATCAANVTFTSSASAILVATNNGTALENLLAAEDYVKLPEGITYGQAPSGVLTVRDGCVLDGVNGQWGASYEFASRGSVLITSHQINAAAGLIIGSQTAFGVGRGHAVMRNIAFDCFWFAQDAVQLLNWGGVIRNCYIQGGTTAQLNITGVGADVRDNLFSNRLASFYGIRINASDVVFEDNIIRGCGAGQFMISIARSAVRVIGNHTYESDTLACGQVIITGGASVNYGIVVSENEFEVGLGHQIVLQCTSSAILRSVNISDNIFYHTGALTEDTYDVVNANAAAGCSIDGVTVTGNVIYSVDNNYRSIFGDVGVVPVNGLNVSDNVANAANRVWFGPEPLQHTGNRISTEAARTTFFSSEEDLHIQGQLSSAQILALNATPITLVPAPPAGYAIIFLGATLWLDYNSAAYAGIAVGEDLAIRYAGGGPIVGECETTGFLDQTADEIRYVYPIAAAAVPPIGDVEPGTGALVAQMLVGEVITGNSPINYRVKYKLVQTSW